ncbi:hypothetical protein MUK42_04038 [Musa troglodytarum]|uniref:Uncharacterized protein n=1 Tax=Musa troglodytarum TaxID=320322 RepID=A0A9E7HTH3_9LILI|nr:hypothetical protein MUK42_04038 [Musa troglodytarum]
MGGGGGGEHGSHGGAGAAGDFRTKVWSMTGGPYCRPKHWKHNTAIAVFGVFLVCIPLAIKSTELEVVILSLVPLSCHSLIVSRFDADTIPIYHNIYRVQQ